MNLSLNEQETMLNLVADDRGTWHAYSDDPVMQRKLEAVGAVLIKSDGTGKHYTLRANQVSFRKGEKRELSDAQRASIEKLAASRRKTDS